MSSLIRIINARAHCLAINGAFRGEDWEDIAGELMVIVLPKIDRYDPNRGVPLEAFFKMLVKRAGISLIRSRTSVKRRRARRVQSLHAMSVEATCHDDRQVDPGDAAIDNELLEKLREVAGDDDLLRALADGASVSDAARLYGSARSTFRRKKDGLKMKLLDRYPDLG